MAMSGKGGIRQVTWEAKVIRADGAVEELGVISRWHKNPLVRLWWRVTDTLKRR